MVRLKDKEYGIMTLTDKFQFQHGTIKSFLSFVKTKTLKFISIPTWYD